MRIILPAGSTRFNILSMGVEGALSEKKEKMTRKGLENVYIF
jgi:hypothetical protein